MCHVNIKVIVVNISDNFLFLLERKRKHFNSWSFSEFCRAFLLKAEFTQICQDWNCLGFKVSKYSKSDFIRTTNIFRVKVFDTSGNFPSSDSEVTKLMLHERREIKVKGGLGRLVVLLTWLFILHPTPRPYQIPVKTTFFFFVWILY